MAKAEIRYFWATETHPLIWHICFVTKQSKVTTGDTTAGGRSPVGARLGAVIRVVAGATLSATAGLAAFMSLGEVIPGAIPRAAVSVLSAGIVVGIALAGILRPSMMARDALGTRTEGAAVDALRDPLTGLGNHRTFHDELQREVSEAQRYGVPLALVLIDLDEFRQINDQHGHAEGDRVLAGFAGLISGAARDADRCFRTGGDEFALILPHTDADGASVVARRLLIAALESDPRRQDATAVSFSAGISSVPALASSLTQLYAQAEAALRAVKRAGRTDVFVFDPHAAADEALVGSGDAVAELIARGRLTAVYQPIFDLATGTVLGWEGLIRPMSPSPFLDPVSLFAAAEAGGQLVALDFACMETIVAGAGRLPEGAFLSVNLSPRTLEAAEFSTAALLAILGRHDLAPRRLVIELTERQPIDDVERVLVKLDTFRRAGIRLAADHLGAGNAGLRLLTDLRFDIVKVDLGLVHRTAPGGRASAVVESIVAFAARTGALVVGEGVEDADQIDQLLALGVPAAQGYLLGRPGALPESTVGETPPLTAIPDLQAAARAVEEELLTWRRSLGLPANPVLAIHKAPVRAASRTARASSTTSG